MSRLSSIYSMHMDKQITNWSTKYEQIPVYIMIFIVEGKVDYHVNNEHFIAEQGDLIIIPIHSYRSGSNYKDTVHIKFSILLQNIQSPFFPKHYFNQLIKFKLHNHQAILRKFEQLYDEYLNQDVYYPMMSESILNEIFILLARELSKPEVPPMKMRYVEQMKEYIIKNLNKKIEIEALSQLINKTQNYTISLFREVIGCSPITYVHQLRLIEAGNLMLTTNMSISDIATYLGYYDPAYFNRMFKKYTSFTPSEFKKIGKPLLLEHMKLT